MIEIIIFLEKKLFKISFYISTACQPLVFRELQNAHSTIMDVAVVSFKTYLRIFSRKIRNTYFL